MKEISDVFSVEEKLEPMNCPPMSIHLKPGAIPTYISTPRKIGPSLKPPSKKELDDMVSKEIIEKVPVDYVTEWCAPFCPREKESGGIRPTVDFRGLDAWVQRTAQPQTTPYEAVHNVTPGSRWFTVMDAKKRLSPDSIGQGSAGSAMFYDPVGEI